MRKKRALAVRQDPLSFTRYGQLTHDFTSSLANAAAGEAHQTERRQAE